MIELILQNLSSETYEFHSRVTLALVPLDDGPQPYSTWPRCLDNCGGWKQRVSHLLFVLPKHDLRNEDSRVLASRKKNRQCGRSFSETERARDGEGQRWNGIEFEVEELPASFNWLQFPLREFLSAAQRIACHGARRGVKMAPAGLRAPGLPNSEVWASDDLGWGPIIHNQDV